MFIIKIDQTIHNLITVSSSLYEEINDLQRSLLSSVRLMEKDHVFYKFDRANYRIDEHDILFCIYNMYIIYPASMYSIQIEISPPFIKAP